MHNHALTVFGRLFDIVVAFLPLSASARARQPDADTAGVARRDA
jgi:hypothetical protein